MRKLEIWIVYDNKNGEMLVVKTKRLAKRIVLFGNKFCNLINVGEPYSTALSKDFFKTHAFDKQKIEFQWDIDLEEKMILLKKFQEEGKCSHEENNI